MNKTPHIMYVEGTKGEVIEPGFEGWIYVESVAKGIRNPAVPKGSRLASTTAVFDSFNVSKAMDKASPQLLMDSIRGRFIDEVKVVLRRVGKLNPKTGGSTLEPYMEWKFKNCFVESVNISGASHGDPSESISFRYESEEFSFFSLVQGKKTDTAVGAWNMKTRTPTT